MLNLVFFIMILLLLTLSIISKLHVFRQLLNPPQQRRRINLGKFYSFPILPPFPQLSANLQGFSTSCYRSHPVVHLRKIFYCFLFHPTTTLCYTCFIPNARLCIWICTIHLQALWAVGENFPITLKMYFLCSG